MTLEIRSRRFGAAVVALIAIVLLLAAGSHADATGVCLYSTKQHIFSRPNLIGEKDTALLKSTTMPIREDTVLDIRIEKTNGGSAWASVTRIRSPGVPGDLLGKSLRVELGQCFTAPSVGTEGTIRGTLWNENNPIPDFVIN
jgi:hypothetical protein